MQHTVIALALSLSASAPPPSNELSLGVEASQFLAIYASDQGLGARLQFTHSRGDFVFGAATTFFPSPLFSFAADFLAGFRWPKPWGEIKLYSGAGFLYTSDETFIPTYTDVRMGPAFQLGSDLRWQLTSLLFAQVGGSLHFYPLQRMEREPGLDFRWNLGAGLRF